MSTFIRTILFIIAFLIVTGLYALSKELFPPSALIGGLRGLFALTLLYGAWQLIKKIDIKK